MKISVEDIIDFISNILDKISDIPGVGDIMTFIDKAMESVMGFVEDLIPEGAIFPDFDMVRSHFILLSVVHYIHPFLHSPNSFHQPISVDDLNFGALTSTFENINLPELPSFPNPVDGLLDKLAEDFPDTPFGDIVNCGTDAECFGDALGLTEAMDFVEGIVDKIEGIAERFETTFGALDDVKLIACSEWGTKSIECSKVFTFLNLEEDCSIDIPWCKKLEMGGLEAAFSELVDVFDDLFDSEDPESQRRRHLLVGKGTFMKLAPLEFALEAVFPTTPGATVSTKTKVVADMWRPNQQIGVHFLIKSVVYLNIGIYNSDCGHWGLGIEPQIGVEFMIGGTHGVKSMLSKALGIVESYDRGGKTENKNTRPDVAVPGCFDFSPDGLVNKCKDTEACKEFACKAWDLLYQENQEKGKDESICSHEELKKLVVLTEKDGLNEKQEKEAARCIEHWFGKRKQAEWLLQKSNNKLNGLHKKIYYGIRDKFTYAFPPVWFANAKENKEEYDYNGLKLGVFVGGYDGKKRFMF